MTGGSPDRDDGVGDDLREVLLTLTAAEFERFASDLRLLRHHRAESNTQAIIEAVRESAAKVKVPAVYERDAA
jgi:hypothetical protein